jgi:hypothetical protein
VILVVVIALLNGVTACTQRKPETQRADEPSPIAAKETASAIVSETTEGPGAEQHLAICRVAADELGGALKAALQEAMQRSGPAGALDVCSVEAVPIARRISAQTGARVGRTSERVRNPANAPDAWEQAGLVEFAARIEAGQQPVDLERWAVVTDASGHRTFRFLKAIPTAPLCLRCHGRELAPEVVATLEELYPDDRATGFAVGDLRGAFTVALPLD